MDEIPFGISPCTVGAEYTRLSNTIATLFLLFGSADAAAVIERHARAPSAFITITTSGLPF